MLLLSMTRLISCLLGGALLSLLGACQTGHFVTDKRFAVKLPPLRPYHGMVPVGFCQLPEVKKRLVYVRGTYSGVDEYWSFSPHWPSNHADKACWGTTKVELTLPDTLQVPTDMQAKFDSTHQSYPNHYLIVDAVGRYEDNQPGGYGHVGHNKAQFVVAKLVQVRLVTVSRKGRILVD
ncbi:hypothetical protein LJ737_02780 [Hymenobacter sp. 15J16-1T3B]|uniref:hypothetical protein n=1 Tax=Hymenobacter sp. 15J16-1T3B TaxID=2886941 RepID=UPI001D0F5811|nr:hypothetical protein [Hymenobacter sp. 15J16-1T3B]MCC3156142.1 hypothetical protein [Hymenobacter sp. 15J16-1T3B]